MERQPGNKNMRKKFREFCINVSGDALWKVIQNIEWEKG